jgi:3-methyl-2-oxobutanoate hydroxymethyltransferase
MGPANTFVTGDMPFLSYQVSVPDAVRNAGRFHKEAGVDAIKLEGGKRV